MIALKSLERLVQALRRLPGLGPKQAERLALHLLRAPEPEAQALIAALREARERVRLCPECLTYAEGGLCAVCADPGRDRAMVCVVEEASDVAAIERSRGYRGLYHVLHGALSPLEGVGPEALRVGELLRRLERPGCAVSEVIVATDPDTEGDATALYLSGALKGLPVRITRIAMGVPMGGDLDYADARTLSSALEGRRPY